MRHDGRTADSTRPVKIQRGFLQKAEGSALIEMGNTRVICTATIDAGVPRFLYGKGVGWVTGEYGMLPRSTNQRMQREAARGRGGRTYEIQRLIGRSLRAATQMNLLGENTAIIDCDVIEADGGTRSASITGGCVALYDAIRKLNLPANPINFLVSAISVGVVGGNVLLDLDYSEDSSAEVDLNVVMSESGAFIEIQGTAEKVPFTDEQLQQMLTMARKGCMELIEAPETDVGNIARVSNRMKIVLATRNSDKIKEIEAIMDGVDVSLLRADAFDGIPDVVEDGNTLEENALKKARAIRDFTGSCALSDDTGLEVDALDGAPGVFSARYAGAGGGYEANNRKLLDDLSGVPTEKRTARFRCVMAFALAEEVADRLHDSGAAAETDTPDALVTEGILEGRITTDKRGTSGFGYDPIFEVPGLGKTLSEIGLEEKNRISHRYRALVEMRELLLRMGLVHGGT